jgi:pimeloyl-ACP methyl ester carboxylesterase
VSKLVDLDGPVHYLDFGGDGVPMVCIHGLGGSALNWIVVAGRLAERYRVVAVDLRGFGLTPPGGVASTLEANQRLLDRFIREVAGTPAILVGNSMGGLLALTQASLHPDTVRAALLVDPALPWPAVRRRVDPGLRAFFTFLLVPGLPEIALAGHTRLAGTERVVDEVLELTCADPDRVPAAAVAAHMTQYSGALGAPRAWRPLAQAGRSLVRALWRDHTALYQAVRIPVLIVHGDRDRLVEPRFSRLIGTRFGWPVEILPGSGHVPMLETPDAFLRVANDWLDGLDAGAAGGPPPERPAEVAVS